MTPRLLRLVLLLAVLGPGAGYAGVPAGVAAAVRGSVSLDRAPEIGRRVASGDSIHLGDILQTGPKGGMQLLLLDETVFTLGPDSRLVIDEFVYDPGQHGGKMQVRLAKGVFRFVTGKIARDEPENVDLELPVGSIGIRGTIGGARVGAQESVVALLGPGPLNDADERIGGLVVRTPGGEREIVTPGWAVTISGAGPPSVPFHAGPGGFLPPAPPQAPGPPPGSRPAPAGSDGSGLDPEESAGAVRAGGLVAGRTPRQVARQGAALEGLDPSGLRTPDEQNLQTFVPEFAGQGLNFPDGITRVVELVQYSNQFQGSLHWEIKGALLNTPPTGIFDAEVIVDFAKRDVGFKFEKFNSLTFVTSGMGAPLAVARPFASGSNGNADFVLTGQYIEPSGCVPCNVTLNSRFSNRNNQPAREGDFFIVISNGGTVATSGPFKGPPTLIMP